MHTTWKASLPYRGLQRFVKSNSDLKEIAQDLCESGIASREYKEKIYR